MSMWATVALSGCDPGTLGSCSGVQPLWVVAPTLLALMEAQLAGEAAGRLPLNGALGLPL